MDMCIMGEELLIKIDGDFGNKEPVVKSEKEFERTFFRGRGIGYWNTGSATELSDEKYHLLRWVCISHTLISTRNPLPVKTNRFEFISKSRYRTKNPRVLQCKKERTFVSVFVGGPQPKMFLVSGNNARNIPSAPYTQF
ncbi:hypothetical protein C0J52_25597 [Blattella germanica]|nr:hypothetical protein C0J52_25597 [Blattella germanica]